MKKNLSLHKFLSLALILAMIGCITACGCGRNVPNNTATESGPANTENTTGNTQNSTDNLIGSDNTMTTTETTITNSTDGLLGDTVDGVINGVGDVVDGVENGMGINNNMDNTNTIDSVTSETTTETAPITSSDTRNHTR